MTAEFRAGYVAIFVAVGALFRRILKRTKIVLKKNKQQKTYKDALFELAVMRVLHDEDFGIHIGDVERVCDDFCARKTFDRT